MFLANILHVKLVCTASQFIFSYIHIYIYIFSGICYLPCDRSSIATASFKSTYLAPSNPKYTKNYTICVWTLTSKNVSRDTLLYGTSSTNENILFTILKTSMSCFDSHLVIYDGMPPNPQTTAVLTSSKFKRLGNICGFDNKRKTYHSESGFLTLIYEGKTGKPYIDAAYKSPGFLAQYTLLSCPESCPVPFVCSELVCKCNDGWYGPICQYKKCLKCLNGGTCNQVNIFIHT